MLFQYSVSPGPEKEKNVALHLFFNFELTCKISDLFTALWRIIHVFLFVIQPYPALLLCFGHGEECCGKDVGVRLEIRR